ncbi:RagB/SusD family nutrient uptake outer membrane protein [Pedobacter xixiisoli]|uniref:Starch-binding associating with outer membrane n=1 Tax=Pedobacter xixiisoli TaxID=1476464 RepID=A0A286A0D2_9SPHI|nr:RagB/SusD family nutrient uptake outer membrane protein [Pedobacter xixiisoli]SOD15345.1 Starch-binding associating with outer membrane [Pedobacter xixiisoli]
MKYTIAIIFSGCVLLTGCVKLDVAPTDRFTEANYWSTADKASSVVNMAYRQMFSSDNLFNNEVLSDNVYSGYGNTNEKLIATGQADASNGRFASEWDDCYGGIKTCHTFLENVDRVPNMNGALKERMKAEIRFIRAFLYLRLTTHFGDVPFYTKDITLAESKSIARTPSTQIKNWIHTELDEVAAVLPSNLDYAVADRGRITKGAAVALNARAYLYESNFLKVAEYCNKLVNTTNFGTYTLFPTYEGLFLASNEYNSESILEMGYVPQLRTWGNLVDYAPLSAEARLSLAAPTQELVDSYLMTNGNKWVEGNAPYAGRDFRMGATIVYDGSTWRDRSGVTYPIVINPDGVNPAGRVSNKYTGQGQATTATGYYYRKYADPNPSTYTLGWASNLNLPLIRFADVLLMYAEAMHENGAMTQAVWDQTIKPLRLRAGFDNTTAAVGFPTTATPLQLQEIIRNERRCELALEGLRVFDIRRWKTAPVVLTSDRRGAKFEKVGGVFEYIKLTPGRFNVNRDYLWAVPRKERVLNANLSQNPGY